MKRQFLGSCCSRPRAGAGALLAYGQRELSNQGPATAGLDSPMVTGPGEPQSLQRGCAELPQRREGDLGVKSANSVSSEEGRALPCLTGPQGTGKVGMVVRVWVKTGASSRVPTGARPGPEASARCPGLRTHVVSPIVLCVNQVKFPIVVRYTQHETFHPNHVYVCTPVALSTFIVLCSQSADSFHPAELKLYPIKQLPSSWPQPSALWLCESHCSRRLI